MAHPQGFLRERCARDPGWFEHSHDLWAAYEAWCAERGLAPVTRTAFGWALRRAGYRNERGRIVTWMGIRLRPAPKP